MTCIAFHDTDQKSVILKSKDLATCGFQKMQDTPTKTHWSHVQYQKGQPTHCQTTYAFSRSPLGLIDTGLKPTIQNSIKHENGHGLESRKVNFLEYLGQGTLGCHSLSSLLQQPYMYSLQLAIYN